VTETGFSLRFDARHGVLLVTAGEWLTSEIFEDMFDAVVRFRTARGPSSLILDLSCVERFDLPRKILLGNAEAMVAIPPEMSRVVVAQRPDIFDAMRLAQSVRARTKGPLILVRTLAEAYAVFSASEADFSGIM
jgi:hypothetical protein